MYRLKKFLNWTTNMGIGPKLDFYDQLKFRAFNKALLAVLAAFLMMTIFDIFEHNETLIYSVLGLLLVVFIFVLSHLRLHIIGALIFAVVYPILLFFLTITYGDELNITYAYFAFIVIVLLAFESLWLKILLSLFIFSLQVVSIYYTRFYGSIIEKEIPFLDGILVLVLPSFGVGILILMQVTAIKKLYQDQIKINEELEIKNQELTASLEQNEAKNHLLAIVAHDLKEPASTFINLTQNLAYTIRKEKPEELEKIAHNFEISGTKLYHIISNLLSWVTVQQGDLSSHPDQSNLLALVNEVIQTLSLQAEEKNITIRYAGSQPVEFVTDGNILKIILFNLLSNAIKFTYTGGEVVISYQTTGDDHIIEVIDFGQGIKGDVLQKIQAGEIISTKGTSDEKGYGIGLKICYALIEKLNGKLEVSSELKKGSTFRVYIPKTQH